MDKEKSKTKSTEKNPPPIVVKPAGNAPGTMQVQNMEDPPKGKIRQLTKL